MTATTSSTDIVKAKLKQNGLQVLADTTTWINRFVIQSESSNREYIIAQRANLSEWGCSCPGWKRYRNCKHLNTVQPLLNSMPKS